MKKLVLIAISSLLSMTAHSQFVTYENVPRPNVSIPKSNFNFEFKRPTTPSVSVVNSDIVTTEALCVQTEGESFTIGTKVIVRRLSNGATTLGLIGIKQGQKWNSIDEINLLSISQLLARAKTKEEKDYLLMLSDFSYMAALGESSLLLFNKSIKMKKILLLSIMLILCSTMRATVYTFVTSGGTFKIYKESNLISFKDRTYNIVEEGKDDTNYMVCKSDNTIKLIRFDFANDNIIEYDYVETFEWKDVAFYDKAKLVAGLYRNIDTYIYNNNLKGDKAVMFRKYAGIMIEGIQDGTITMNNNGSFTDSTGKLSSDGTFDKTWTGKKKNTLNNILNLVADYIIDYLPQMPILDSCWQQVGKPYLILKANKSE